MKTQTYNSKILVSICSIILFLMSSTAIAVANNVSENSTFKITSKMIIDGNLISSPVIITKSNQKSLIVLTNTNNASSQGIKMELIANSVVGFGINNLISIKYDIQYRNGQIKLHSNPQVIVEPNKEVRVQLSSDTNHLYEMNVLAERVNS